MAGRLIAILTLAAVVIFSARHSRAMPAAPTLHLLQQADRGTVSARQWGDEYGSGWETVDGYTVVFDAGQVSWTYGVHDRAGELVSSGRRPDREQPPAGVRRHIRPKRIPAMARLAAAAQAVSSPRLSPATSLSSPASAAAAPEAPVIRNLPVILINFSDTTPTYTVADFFDLLFGCGVRSLKEYYEEVSGGRFSLSPGPAGVVNWVTAAQPHDYYGARSGWGPPDILPGDLAYEAVLQADAVVDYSAYDSDGDCQVDTVAIVHQGTAQEGSGIVADIWSHSWSLSVTYGYGLSHYGPYTTNDRCVTDPERFVIVDRYIMMPELYGSETAGIGVFAHEYGHAIGLIDLYDTDRSSEGVGNWSLMASGSWGGVGRLGNRPAHPDPWSKLQLGWIAPEPVTGSTPARSIAAVETGGAVLRFLPLPTEGGTGEYFLLENRQQTGFDEALPGAGLLLWHIDETRSGNSREWYPGCTTCSSHYKVALVQSDNRYDMEKNVNRGDAGDPFPGAADNRAVTPWTPLPASLYSGAPAGFGISAISDSGMVMSADITLYDLVPPVTIIRSFPTAPSASGSGRFTFRANEPAVFECSLDGTTFLPCNSPFIFSDLADGSHTFTVRATDPAGNVETVPPVYAWTVDTVTPLCSAKSAGICHQSIADAYAAIPSGSSGIIQLQQGDYPETLDFASPVGVRLEGGYSGDFLSRPGTSTIAAKVAVSAGSLVIDRVLTRYDVP